MVCWKLCIFLYDSLSIFYSIDLNIGNDDIDFIGDQIESDPRDRLDLYFDQNAKKNDEQFDDIAIGGEVKR